MLPKLNLELPELEWITLLKGERDRGKSVSQIARETGIARSSLSMLLSNTYPAQSLDLVTAKYANRVLQLYRAQVHCPHLRRGIGADICRGFAAAAMPTSSAERLAHWATCRRCPHNPQSGEQK